MSWTHLRTEDRTAKADYRCDSYARIVELGVARGRRTGLTYSELRAVVRMKKQKGLIPAGTRYTYNCGVTYRDFSWWRSDPEMFDLYLRLKLWDEC
jgi:hypothetical protein